MLMKDIKTSWEIEILTTLMIITHYIHVLNCLAYYIPGILEVKTEGLAKLQDTLCYKMITGSSASHLIIFMYFKSRNN